MKPWTHYRKDNGQTMCGFNPMSFEPPLPTTRKLGEVDCPVCKDEKRKLGEAFPNGGNMNSFKLSPGRCMKINRCSWRGCPRPAWFLTSLIQPVLEKLDQKSRRAKGRYVAVVIDWNKS